MVHSEEEALYERPDIEDAARLLPAWFVPRMMDDYWSFGLLLVTGQVLAVREIRRVTQARNGNVWLDVTLAETDATCPGLPEGVSVLTAPTSEAVSEGPHRVPSGGVERSSRVIATKPRSPGATSWERAERIRVEMEAGGFTGIRACVRATGQDYTTSRKSSLTISE